MGFGKGLIKSRKYRKDIDGLRAIAVLTVIAFHFGYLPAGYLGVDVFFVISGYLITGIIYREYGEGQFSIRNFYLRRTKRIIPLVLFICLVSLILGVFLMLPDDLENLAQSVVATNFFNNNTLQILTTKNYWDVVNEYKPLMHTWSLGIEEQYYLVYPFLFLLLGKFRRSWVLWSLILLTFLSLGLYLGPFSNYLKFYLLPFRFFELSIGGIIAILLGRNVFHHSFALLLIVLLTVLLSIGLTVLPDTWLLIITVLVTCGILISANRESLFASRILENPIMVYIGKISFSLYMWHQVLLAFSRYTLFQEITSLEYILILAFTFILSGLTYSFIEQPFRRKIPTRIVLTVLTLAFLLTTAVSLYIYKEAGVIRDVPELSLKRGEGQRNIHAQYNDRVNNYNRDFKEKGLKILAIGNSFVRDWCNVLLESKFSDSIQIYYTSSTTYNPETRLHVEQADFVFVSEIELSELEKLQIPSEKIWYVGTKNFGVNNGIFYNYSGSDYCQQRTKMEDGYLELNRTEKIKWGVKYIDLIGLVLDENSTVPVYTPDCKFISQDCRHFTKAGAQYFAQLLEPRLTNILQLQHEPITE